MGSLIDSLNKGLEDKYRLGENNNEGGKETMNEKSDGNAQSIVNELKNIERSLDAIKNQMATMADVLADAIVDKKKPTAKINGMK